MSILHLLDRTTDSDEAYRQTLSADASTIFVDADAQIESFSIELTVGTNWSERYGRTNAMVAIDSDGITFATGGSIVIEAGFSLQGLGQLAWESVARNDFPVVQAIVLVLAMIYIALTLAADLLNAFLDPRLRQ